MRVLIVDDHPLFRTGIASLLHAWAMEVVGQASNGLEAVTEARDLQPDLILMDINLPGLSGLEATRLIKSELPQTKIVMLTVSDDTEDLFEAIRSGADGYMLKDMSEEDFGRTLRGVVNNEPPLSPGLAAKILREFSRLSRADEVQPPSSGDLTEREREVLQLAATGATNREIGATLVISENTVNFHMKHVFAKLHLKNRSQAVAHALRAGIVSFPPPHG
jgi:DNA-binding NarL/FixJ family response regulator